MQIPIWPHDKPCRAVELVAGWLICISAVWAGGGPENVAVVVNADSFASQAVANAFLEFRQVPAVNVVSLSLGDLPDFETVDVAVFRRRVLRPVLETLEQRGLAAQIDCLVYSSDIPFAVRVHTDIGDRKLPQILTPTASATGLTYLYGLTLAENPAYLSLSVNAYDRLPTRTGGEGDPPWTEDEGARFRRGLKQLADKEYAAAVETLEGLTETRARTPELWYSLACALARQDKADEAMQALERAVVAGWTNVRQLLKADDLSTLRPRDDFQRLVKDLQDNPLDLRPTLGFRGVVGWDADGQPVPPPQGLRYLLSTMLSVTSGRGLSVREAVEHLRRSAAADSTFPTGTVYLMDHTDIRARTRRPLFEPAAKRLQELGVRAEIVSGILPQGRDDVMGLVAGTADFDWPASGSRILPGAVCEHLTSFGGAMQETAGQTPLTEFLRHGAALSSGTVAEPYAIAAKFPSPFLHAHYAAGCSAAEAFYQSLPGPYQLLIVGDPLCMPSARRPTVQAPDLASPLRGRVEFQPSPVAPEGQPIARFDWFVGGVRRAACRAGETLQLDTTHLPDGPHEFRLVAIVADAIQTQGRAVWTARVDNHGRSVQLELDGPGQVTLGQSLSFRANAPRAEAIELHHAGRVLSRIDASQGRFTVETDRLGLGQVQLSAAAFFPGVHGPGAVSEPVTLRIEPPPALEPIATPEAGNGVKGISVAVGDRPPQIVETTHSGSWLRDLGAQRDEPITIEGFFTVPEDDLYQFQLFSPRQVRISVGETTVYASDDGSWKIVPVALKRGTYRMRVEVQGKGPPQLRLRFGGPGAYSVGSRQFRTGG